MRLGRILQESKKVALPRHCMWQALVARAMTEDEI
jgi:hypothetical protein